MHLLSVHRATPTIPAIGLIINRCCKGFLIYGGLQRSVGQEPRCLGLRQPLPNVIVTEEDAGESGSGFERSVHENGSRERFARAAKAVPRAIRCFGYNGSR